MTSNNNLPATENDNTILERFENEISRRIRKDLGQLLPDDILAKLCRDAVHAELYRKTNRDTYGDPKPWICEEVKYFTEKQLKLHVTEAFASQEETIKTMLTEEIKKQLPTLIATFIVQTFSRNNEYLVDKLLAKFDRNY